MNQDNQQSAERDPRTHAIIGAAMEVHSQLGHGFLEPVYQEALAVEFSFRGIAHVREVDLIINYKGTPLGCTYKPDFICFDQIIVEIKALSSLTGIEVAQVLNYLKATAHPVGLLINFGAPRLEFKRLIFSPHHSRTQDKISTDVTDERR